MAVVYVNNLTVNSGEDFEQDFDLIETGGNTINLTNYTAKAQIRKHPDSSSAINFTIGFPNRAFGKINLSIPSWTTSKLKQGRYVYDVLVTKPGGKKEIVLEGSVLVRAGISTGCDFSLPNSAQRTCIAIIPDSNVGVSTLSDKWYSFRGTYPNRIFYLLQKTSAGFGVSVTNTNYDDLDCPDNFLSESTVNTPPLI